MMSMIARPNVNAGKCGTTGMCITSTIQPIQPKNTNRAVPINSANINANLL